MSEEKLGFGENLEQEIIALCTKDVNFFVDVHEYLTPKHFMSDKMGKAYAVIKTYFDEHHSVPNEATIKYMLGKLQADSDIEFKVNKLNRDFLLSETIRLVRHQELKKFIFSSLTEVEKGNPDLGKLEEKMKKILNIQPTHDLGTFYYDIDERFLRLKNLNTIKLPTGIPTVDKALNGGLAPKELVCFGAASGVGKSFLLCIAGAHILKTCHNVVHYTLEMSEEITSLRYDCALLDKTTEEIYGDFFKAKEGIEKYKKIMTNNLVIKEFPTKTASVNTFRSHLNKLKEQRNFIPDVIIVDYGDIMKPTRNVDKRYEEQGLIFQELRGLGQELNVPILSATQGNRGSGMKDQAGMEDLGDSYDKARIMDGLFFLMQKPEEKEDGLFRLRDAKVRNGKAGGIHNYEIDYPRAKIRLVEEG